MALVEFKRNKNPKNKIVMGITAFIVLIILVGLTRTIIGIGHKTITPNPTVLFDEIEGRALVIKSEKVYKSGGTGSIEHLASEGDKVPVGLEIVKISTSNEEIKSQLESVEKQLEELGIEHYSDEENSGLLEDIQKKISQGNYSDISSYLENLEASEENDNLISEKLEGLLKKQNELSGFLEELKIPTLSEDSGIVSYKIDGYEEILKPTDFEKYTYDTLDFDTIEEKLVSEESKETTTGGSPIFKILDDYTWYLALKIEDERILEFEEGQVFDFRLNDEGTTIGRLVAVNVNDSNGVLVIRFRDKLYEFYENRIMDISLIKSESNSFEIPSRSIVTKDGQAGVYINHIYGVVRFVPVLILYEDEENDITYVDRGNSKAYITIDGEEVRTVTQYDEVFLNPNNFKEDQILK